MQTQENKLMKTNLKITSKSKLNTLKIMQDTSQQLTQEQLEEKKANSKFFEMENNEENQRIEAIGPFTLIWKKDRGYQLGFANYALTPYVQDEETLLAKIQYKRISTGDVIYQGKFDWNIMLGMIEFALIDDISCF